MSFKHVEWSENARALLGPFFCEARRPKKGLEHFIFGYRRTRLRVRLRELRSTFRWADRPHPRRSTQEAAPTLRLRTESRQKAGTTIDRFISAKLQITA